MRHRPNVTRVVWWNYDALCHCGESGEAWDDVCMCGLVVVKVSRR
jgi:hypothetical protein